MRPERSVMMSLILISWETVEKLEWAALLWILMLAKARSGPSRTGIADIRSDLGQPSNPERLRGQNQRNPGRREAEGQLAASLARYSPCGDAPRLLLAIRPSASKRDTFHFSIVS